MKKETDHDIVIRFLYLYEKILRDSLDKRRGFAYNMRVILNLEDVMAEYATEQKKLLLSFLREHCDLAYTVEELLLEMKEAYGAEAPGKSTVYRLMTRLVEEGTVKRFVRGHSRQFAYQIVVGEHCHSHLHLKCMGCGKLIHLDEGLSDELLDKVRASSDFAVDEEETVLFGACAACHRENKKRNGDEE